MLLNSLGGESADTWQQHCSLRAHTVSGRCPGVCGSCLPLEITTFLTKPKINSLPQEVQFYLAGEALLQRNAPFY